MENLKKCDKSGSHVHCFYSVKIPPSQEEREREEAEKKYHFVTLARLRINEEIDHQKGIEHQIQKYLMWFEDLDKRIEWKMTEIKNLERYTIKPAKDTQTPIRPDRKRCHKRLIKKGKIDTEYLQQVEEDLLSSKKSGKMTSFGTQELNDLVECLTQIIQHGDKKRADELKIYEVIKKLKKTEEIYNALEPNSRNHWHSRELRSKRDTDWQRSIQHTIQIRLDDIEDIKRAQRGRKTKVTRLKADLEFVRKKISSLKKELIVVETERIKAYERVYELRDQMKELV